MKNAMILLIAFLFFGIGQAVAQSTGADATLTAADAKASDHSKEIAMADLPNAISTALRGNDYAGWTIANAWHVKKDGHELYKVKMTKGNEVQKVKMKADGTIVQSDIRHKDKMHDKNRVK